MKPRRSWGFAALVFGLSIILVAGSLGGAGEKDKVPEEEPPAALDEEVTKVDLAYGLIDYGRRSKTPEALVTAAIMLSRVPIVEPSDKSDEKPKLSEENAKEIQALLSEAGAMRPADKLLKELVGRTQEDVKEASRSLVGANDAAGVRAYRKLLAARKLTTIATIRKAKGQTVSATSTNRTVRVSVVAVSSGKTIATGIGSTSAKAPATGDYRIVAYPPGTVAIQTTFGLR